MSRCLKFVDQIHKSQGDELTCVNNYRNRDIRRQTCPSVMYNDIGINMFSSNFINTTTYINSITYRHRTFHNSYQLGYTFLSVVHYFRPIFWIFQQLHVKDHQEIVMRRYESFLLPATAQFYRFHIRPLRQNIVGSC